MMYNKKIEMCIPNPEDSLILQQTRTMSIGDKVKAQVTITVISDIKKGVDFSTDARMSFVFNGSTVWNIIELSEFFECAKSADNQSAIDFFSGLIPHTETCISASVSDSSSSDDDDDEELNELRQNVEDMRRVIFEQRQTMLDQDRKIAMLQADLDESERNSAGAIGAMEPFAVAHDAAEANAERYASDLAQALDESRVQYEKIVAEKKRVAQTTVVSEMLASELESVRKEKEDATSQLNSIKKFLH